jgi:hypothetical protein
MGSKSHFFVMKNRKFHSWLLDMSFEPKDELTSISCWQNTGAIADPDRENFAKFSG